MSEASERQAAAVEDAQARLVELRAVARALWPDRDDAQVLSELTTIMGEIRMAETQVTVHGGVL